MLVSLVLLMVAPGQADACGLSRPVAPDVTAARRIAETAIRNQAGSASTTDAAARTYRLVVEADREDANQWSAFQVQAGPGSPRGGGGLEFRIDRCTGAISRMHHAR